MVKRLRPRDRKNIWYSSTHLENQRSMDLHNVRVRQALHENEDVEGSWTARGLENELNEDTDVASVYVTRVLREAQRRIGERNLSTLDAEELRNFCLKLSKKDCKQARKRGKEDYKQACIVHQIDYHTRKKNLRKLVSSG